MSEEQKAAEKTPSMEEMLAAMQSLMKKPQQQETSSGWAKPKLQQASHDIQSVSIPLSLETNNGKIRVYLEFPGSVADTPDSLLGLIESLAGKGMPLDFWQSKKDWSKKKGWS